MPTKLVLQQRGASGLENKAEVPALENGKIDMAWLPVVGESGAAIIARGSNANGEWVRWEDGTQVCMGSITITLNSTENYKAGVVTYPASFYTAPTAVSGTYQGSGNGLTSDVGASSVSTCTITVSPARGTTFGTVPEPKTFTYIAIGRWK